MQTNRIDLYTMLHKGIRNRLFQFTAFVGSIDFSNRTVVRTIQPKFHLLIQFLENHEANEDTYIHPLLIHQHLIELLQSTDQEHRRHQKMLLKVESELNYLLSAAMDGETRKRHGLLFYRNLNLWISDYLKHLNREEDKVMSALWDLYDEQQLLQVMGNILQAIPVQHLLDEVATMLPAITPHERQSFFREMKCNPILLQAAYKAANQVLAKAECSTLMAH
ncbi:hemerythrin domain-containing protein [Pajaroellobacter abortibovis]|uniref:Hemerythrin-like domain-containing protein n=1 Tax=Pajaroellobacter abortibovis TaxID=1882918 RepID=A0A1L6MXH7_9BACT|nr:hemerythrin domain-containing protein [Pajaroellobacter abortibovis]APS00291.1 hypothetical protein BCY86_06040 [Pajaroellobacter abortibovis]